MTLFSQLDDATNTVGPQINYVSIRWKNVIRLLWCRNARIQLHCETENKRKHPFFRLFVLLYLFAQHPWANVTMRNIFASFLSSLSVMENEKHECYYKLSPICACTLSRYIQLIIISCNNNEKCKGNAEKGKTWTKLRWPRLVIVIHRAFDKHTHSLLPFLFCVHRFFFLLFFHFIFSFSFCGALG